MNYRIIIFILSFIVMLDVFAASANAKKNSQIISVSNLQIPVSNLKANPSCMNAAEIEQTLGWVTDRSSESLCGGYYFEPSNIFNTPNPKAFQKAPMRIRATKPAFFTQHGASVIQGDVVFSQPGREIAADQVVFYRDNKTSSISKGILSGHVNFREYGKLIVANQSELDFLNKIYSLNDGVYRLLAIDTPTGLANVWGRAKNVVYNATTGIIKLNRATYSTCPPHATMWHIWGNHFTLNRNTNRAEVINAFFFLKKLPIFYVPYLTFSIDRQRKSGFLAPTPTFSKKSGYSINLPYYFNLAPNYDATFTPEYFTKRGILFGGSFRYLTPISTGNINVNYLPHDRAFINYRDSATVPVVSTYDYRRALKALQDSPANRAFFSMQDKSDINEHWRSALAINYATDDYYLQDFNPVIGGIDNDQLLNRFDIKYSDDYWNLLGRLQIFQTLHPITQNNAQDQYSKLPQLSLTGSLPDGPGGLDYGLDSEIVNFMHRDDFYSKVSAPLVGGARFNLMPSISAPLNWRGVQIIPKVQLQATGYNIHDREKNNTRDNDNIMRAYPLFSVDGNAFFNRNVNFFHRRYTQTLEPRVFYLWVPMRNQDDIPLFDTYLPAFDFDQLFRTNRFAGLDRVGDANQIALAVTTRFLDDFGQEQLNAGLGQIVVIHKHQVNIDFLKDNENVDPLKNENLSPLVGKIQYFVSSKINTTLNVAWDPNYHRLNTANFNLQYINSPDRIVNFSYNYTLRGDQFLQDKPIDLNRVGFSIGWKVWRYWNILGSINYNISYSRAQDYFYGLEYNSCCWAIRVMQSRNFLGIGADQKTRYDSKTYVQFLFKGLSSVGTNDANQVATSQISGYQDNFITRFKL